MTIELSYQESDVEDILVENCAGYLGLKFLARQYRTPVGIVDLLATTPGKSGLYFVIEIKKGAIDSHAYVQAHRYTKWLNSEHSKDNKRLFVPLIIGDTLNPDLMHVCEYFNSDHGNYLDLSLYGRTFYRIFKFDIRNGISFSWMNNAQNDYKESLRNNYNLVDRLISERERAEYDLWRICKDRQEDKPALSLVKGGA